MSTTGFIRAVSTVPSLLLALAAPVAYADCHIAEPDAQLCQSGTAAAIAYQRVQKLAAGATAVVTPDAEQEARALSTLLERSGCKAAGASSQRAYVEEIARGPITVEGRAADVVSIRLDHDAYWYIAADSLRGECALVAK